MAGLLTAGLIELCLDAVARQARHQHVTLAGASCQRHIGCGCVTWMHLVSMCGVKAQDDDVTCERALPVCMCVCCVLALLDCLPPSALVLQRVAALQ
jgi:hypothetical protein